MEADRAGVRVHRGRVGGGLIGWIARGASATVTTTFTGGGTTTGDACDNQYTARRLAVGTSVKILSGSGTELATGKIISGPEYLNSGCRQRFVVDGIPLGRGVYLIEIGRWRGTTTEAELRSNTTDILLT